MEKKNRIILFWTLTILGFLSHSLADALPAFWGQSKVINAVLACFVALFTLLHMSELLEAFNPVQLFIMPMMFVVALLMAIDSVKVCKEK